MKRYKHVTLEKRRKIESIYLEGATASEIAEEIGVSRATVYNELRRGGTGKMDRNGREGYSADLAQQCAYRASQKKRKRE